MKLWGGRFTKETDSYVNAFNSSLPFDRRFYKQDIRGSIAHVTMLAKQGIISEDDKNAIIPGLESIAKDIESGALPFDETSEDIHSFVEANLIERVGDAGKRLHTGRSRNDQVALDMRLYARDQIDEMKDLFTFLGGYVRKYSRGESLLHVGALFSFTGIVLEGHIEGSLINENMDTILPTRLLRP